MPWRVRLSNHDDRIAGEKRLQCENAEVYVGERGNDDVRILTTKLAQKSQQRRTKTARLKRSDRDVFADKGTPRAGIFKDDERWRIFGAVELIRKADEHALRAASRE